MLCCLSTATNGGKSFLFGQFEKSMYLCIVKSNSMIMR